MELFPFGIDVLIGDISFLFDIGFNPAELFALKRNIYLNLPMHFLDTFSNTLVGN